MKIKSNSWRKNIFSVSVSSIFFCVYCLTCKEDGLNSYLNQDKIFRLTSLCVSLECIPGFLPELKCKRRKVNTKQLCTALSKSF